MGIGGAVSTGCTAASVSAERTITANMAHNIRSKHPQLRVAGSVLAVMLLATSQPAAAPIPLPDGTYVYTIVDSGSVASSSKIVVSRNGGKIVIAEHALPMEAGQVTRRILSAGTFATLSFTDDVDGKRISTLDVAGNNAVLAQYGRKTTLTAPAGTPFVVFDLNAASFFQLPAVLHFSATNHLALIELFTENSTTPLSASPSTAARPAGVPARDLAMDATVDAATGTLWYDPETYVLDEFDLPSQRIAFVRKSYVDVVESLP
jgi:hypothetical protein